MDHGCRIRQEHPLDSVPKLTGMLSEVLRTDPRGAYQISGPAQDLIDRAIQSHVAIDRIRTQGSGRWTLLDAWDGKVTLAKTEC